MHVRVKTETAIYSGFSSELMVLMASLGERRKFVQTIKISSYCSKVGGLVKNSFCR